MVITYNSAAIITGNPEHTTKRKSNNWIWIIVALLVLVFIALITDFSKTTTNVNKYAESIKQAESTGNLTVQYTYELTMLDYYDELKNNSVATNAKYDGKYVKITGKIYSIEDTQRYYTVGGPFVTHVDVYAIQLTDGTHAVYSSLLTCYFDKTNINKERLSLLSSGEEITLVGIFTTSEWPSGIVVMEDCMVVSKGE